MDMAMKATPEAMPPLPSPRPPAPGATAPAGVAAEARGKRAQGLIRAGIALKMLEGAIGDLGAASDEGQALLKAVSALAKIVPQASPELAGAELKLLQAKAPSVSPMQPAATRQDVLKRLQGLGLGQPASPAPASAGA